MRTANVGLEFLEFLELRRTDNSLSLILLYKCKDLLNY
jgi:hypothetical protein